MKKLLIIIITLFCTTGCYNYQEMNDLGIVTSLGIDYENNEVIVSASIANFKDNKESYITLTQKGANVYEALRTMSEVSSKRIYISHLKVLVISENILKNKTSDFLTFLSNYPFSGIKFNIVVSDGNAKDIIEASTAFYNGSADTIVETLKLNSKYESISTLTTFDMFLSDLISKGKSPILTRIKLLEKSSPSKDNENDKLIKIENLVTINKNGQLTNLSEDESIGYNLLNNTITNTIISAPCPEGNFTVEVKWIKTDIKVLNDNIFDIKISASADMGDFDCKIKNEEEINKFIKENVSSKIKEYVNKTIYVSKSSKTDFIGFGDILYAKKYKYFNNIKDNWEDSYLENLKYNLDVDININKLGNLKTTIKGRENN